MLFAFRLEKDLADDPFFVDQEGGAVQAEILAPIQLLLTPDPVFVDDLVFGIGQQGKGKAEFRTSNFLWLFSSSGLMPMMLSPSFRSRAKLSRRLQACTVQVGVSSCG
jgi:hypothetical protein